MKIEYRRNMKSSSMLIYQDCQMSECEKNMFLHNKIPGLLSAKSIVEDGKTIFWYDITGKQALDAYCETISVNEKNVVNLLAAITGILEVLDQYLLQEKNLFLRADCIYVDTASEQLYFCYLPQEENVITDAFQKLMEYLLSVIDHKDEKAVKLTYSVYESSLKEGYSLSLIREKIKLLEVDEETAPVWNEMQQEDEIYLEKAEGKAADATGSIKETIAEKISISGRIESVVNEIDFTYFKKKLPKEFLEKIKRKDFFSKVKITNQIRKKEKIEPFVFEPEEEQTKISHPTVLLAQVKKEPLGILKYEGIYQMGDMKITKDTYLIGSDEDNDGVIPLETISRHHAKILKEKENYYIEDLNSANGTSIDGQFLSYREKAELLPGQIIKFAEEKFRFI